MERDKGIPILTSKYDAEKIYALIATNALHAMTSALVEMENAAVSNDEMMDKCVWPILHEASRRFDSISKDDLDVPIDGFDYVVG